MKKLFIVSTGRTGTTFFYSLFKNMMKDVVPRREEKPAFKRRGFKLVSRKPTFVDQWYFKLSRDWRMIQNNGNWFIETNCRLFSAADLIRTVYPDAKIYQIVRDGRATVRSWFNKGRYFRADTATRLTPDQVPNDPYESEWDKMNALQKNTWSWKTKNEIIRSRNPDSIFRFEKIFEEPYKDLFRLLDSMEGLTYKKDKVLSALEEKVLPTRNPVIPEFQEWYTNWKNQFWDIAEETMESFGYTRNDSDQLSYPSNSTVD